MNENEHPLTDGDWEKDVLAKLSTPFPAAAVSWKPQTLTKDKTRAMAVAYIDARDVMARLDEVVGPFNWQTKEAEVCGQHVTYLGLKHRFTGEWIWKSDLGFVGGSESENEDNQMKAAKGTASDGLKRAGVRWGIGRYLYALPKCRRERQPGCGSNERGLERYAYVEFTHFSIGRVYRQRYRPALIMRPLHETAARASCHILSCCVTSTCLTHRRPSASLAMA